VIGSPAATELLPVDYALGSGKSGITYVAMIGPDRMVEIRKSFFPPRKSWYTTPGQESGLASDDVGKVHGRDNIRKCFRCHAVTLPDAANVPDPRFFGVGCEACHGPGSAHIAAIEAGDATRDRMEKLSLIPGASLSLRCGVCHGQVAEVASRPHDRALTNRFQVYGLAQSACFIKSNGTLSCATCHAGHGDASHDPTSYAAACLSCHSSPQGKTCPVQPKKDCVRCHMPSKPALPGTGLPTYMADHWIRAHPELSPTPAPR
jgi:hypothetical protein